MIVDKGYYRWTFRNLHNKVGIGEETESENKFSENQNFDRVFGQKTFDIDWCL